MFRSPPGEIQKEEKMSGSQEPGRKAKWRRAEKYVCVACSREQSFCWSCPCGFMICWECMEENYWGMTCNGILWTCPDCGAIRSFGND